MMDQSVLLVMCDENLARIYGRKFEADGWTVDIVHNVEEANRRVAKMRPSVIMIDAQCHVDIPGVVKAFRAMPTILRSKIAVLAPVGEREAIDAAHKAGAHTYLILGHFTPLEVVQKMKRLLLS